MLLVCHSNKIYSHEDICRNYALTDCNILDTVGKVNCFFFSLFPRQSSQYSQKKLVLVQKFLLIQSSFVSLVPLTNAPLIEQLLYYAETVVKHYYITLKCFCQIGSVKRMRKLWDKSKHVTLCKRLLDFLLNISNVLSVISTADKFSQVLSLISQ